MTGSVTGKFLNVVRRGPARLASGLVRGYQLVLSPVLPMSCRFHPTCSDYARDAFAQHGLLRGLGLSLWRLVRCNPWNRGGFDPVPHRHSPACSHPAAGDPEQTAPSARI